MVGILTLLDQPRTLDALARPTSAIISFFLTGTTTLAPIYSDATLSTPAANPVVISSGQLFPSIFLSPSFDYRRRIVYGDGSIHDLDPISPSALTTLRGPGGSDLVGFLQAGTGAIARTTQDKLRESVSVADFGAICNGVNDDTAEVQAAIDYCAANNWPDLIVPGRCYVPGGLTIDRELDAMVDEFFIVGTGRWGGFITDQAGPVFSSTYPITANPLSEFVTFRNIRFEASSSTLAAYAVDGDAFLRMRFDNCFFYRMKCAKTTNYLQQYFVHHCNIRRISGWFLEAASGGVSPFSGSALHVNWTDNTFEKGSRGLGVPTGFLKAAFQIAGGNFSAGIFQGNEGPFTETANTVGANYNGLYFELNTNPEIKPGICFAASIMGNLFDNPIGGGDKYCIDTAAVRNLMLGGNYATNRLCSTIPAFGPNDGGIEGINSAGASVFDNLPSLNGYTGSFTGSLSGFASAQTPTVKFLRSNRLITLSWDDTFATSNSGTMALTGIPAPLLPTGQNVWAAVPIIDNGVYIGMSKVKIASDGITVYRTFDTAGAAFTASGNKGLIAYTLTYRV